MEGKNKIIGRGQVFFPGLPQLDEVLHVEGLKSNLTSISQFCDLGFRVVFLHDACYVINPFQFIIVSNGIRSSNNCCYVYKEVKVINDNLNNNIINIESDSEDDCMIIDNPHDENDESLNTTSDYEESEAKKQAS